MCIDDVKIPRYSLAEELLNAISHGLGAIFGIVTLILMLVKVAPTGDPFKITSSLIYGISLIVLFTISCVYHSLAKNRGKKVLRILDHDAIYILIAGTYAPYMLVALRPHNVWNMGTGTLAYLMFSLVWVACIIGAVFNSINIHKYKILSMICYLVAGWVVVVALVVLWNIIGPAGVLLLLGGGIVYTIGSVIYGIGKKKKYFHSIFHFFVLIGAVLMFISVYCFVL
ncbi:MAG: hemolysin III family protein [Bacilli bacterium]|nr:hemolysin III family protein [Bacilli bacterium]